MVYEKENMMECLALTPLKFILWSSDKKLLRTNIFVNAHPKATVGRLLQYVHSQVYVELRAVRNNGVKFDEGEQSHGIEDEASLGDISDYCLYYRSLNELRLDAYLQEVEPNSQNSLIRLQFEKKRTPCEERGNLEFYNDDQFTTTNLLLNINALSVEKVMSRMELNIPLGITMANLKKMALKLLSDYETQGNSKNLCHVKESHTNADIIGFIVKGEQTPIYLNDPNAELYDDLTLSKILGFDFSPQKNSYFTVMFKVKHGQSAAEEDDDSISIEFISDSTLSMNKMSVTVETTVEDVKEFICSVYTHSLRLSTSDIKLIYKGQLVHELDFAGQTSRIMEYINGTDGAKIHVHINQEYNEPGPGFWSDLFNSPGRFEFSPLRNLESQSMLPSFSSQSRATSNPMSPPEIQSSLMEVGNSKCEFLTESGLPFEVGKEPYFKCLVDGEDEVFIPAHKLEPASIIMELGDSQISLSSLDYIIENGTIKLSPNLIARLESTLEMKIMKNSVNFTETVGFQFGVTNQAPFAPQNGQQTDQRWFFTHIFPVLLLILRTLYLIANNSILPFFFVLELSTILPWKYTTLVAVLFLARTVWSTREIWDIWSEYFSLGEIGEEAYHEIKEYVCSKSLSQQFFKDCESSNSVIDILMSSTLRDLRVQLYESYHLDDVNEENGPIALKSLLENVSNDTLPKEPVDDFLISCLDLYETTRETMPESYQNSMRQLLLLAKRDMSRKADPRQQVWYTRFLHRCSDRIDQFRQSQVAIIVLEHVVPDPRQDTLLVSIVKNLTLFFLIIIPPVKTKVDAILEERARAQERSSREEDKNEQPPSERHIDLIPEHEGHSPVSTGLELHDDTQHGNQLQDENHI